MISDDPKLTEYALGELDPAALEEFEALLKLDAPAQVRAGEISSLAASLRVHLQAQAGEPLRDWQRSEIFEAARQKEKAFHGEPLWRRPVVLSALAASLLVGVSIGMLFPAVYNHQRELSQPRLSEARPGGFRFQMEENAVAERREEPPVNAARMQETPMAGTEPAAARTLIAGANRGGVAKPPVPAAALSSNSPLNERASSGRLLVAQSPAVTNPELPFTGSVPITVKPGSLESRAGLSLDPARPLRTQPHGLGRSFVRVADEPLTNFPLHTGASSYGEVRAALMATPGALPPKSAVRIEELLNAFSFASLPRIQSTQGPAGAFGAAMEVGACPWAPDHRLVLVRIEARSKAGRPVAGRAVLQVEFNPAQADSYRLVATEAPGDSAAVGASAPVSDGHPVVALYEVIPAGLAHLASVAPLKYSRPGPLPGAELLTLKVHSETGSVAGGAQLGEFALLDSATPWTKCSADFRFAAAVASFGMLLEGAPASANLSWEATHALAAGTAGADRQRSGLVRLIEKAAALSR